MAVERDFLIDGYNLLHAAGMAQQRYARGDLDRARGRLLAWLVARLTSEERQRCTVVYDAHLDPPPPDVPRVWRQDDIVIRFTNPGQDADTLIEQLIEDHPAARRLLVVSGDLRLKTAIRRKGGHPISSERFVAELEERRSNPPPPAAPAPSRPRPEGIDWAQEFGDVSVADLAAEIEAEESGIDSDPWSRYVAEIEQQLKDGSFE